MMVDPNGPWTEYIYCPAPRCDTCNYMAEMEAMVRTMCETIKELEGEL